MLCMKIHNTLCCMQGLYWPLKQMVPSYSRSHRGISYPSSRGLSWSEQISLGIIRALEIAAVAEITVAISLLFTNSFTEAPCRRFPLESFTLESAPGSTKPAVLSLSLTQTRTVP